MPVDPRGMDDEPSDNVDVDDAFINFIMVGAVVVHDVLFHWYYSS